MDDPEIYRNPYPESEGDRERTIEEIRERITSWLDVPDDFKTLAMQEAERFADTSTSTFKGHFYGFQLGWTHWIIKNDELNLLGNLGPAAIGLVTLFSAANAPIIATAFGLALSVVTVARKIKTKSIDVSSEDYHVLMTLKAAGPSTVSRIAELLGGIHVYGAGLWDDSRTLAALNKLKQVPQLDGSTTALVNESSDGRWSTSGI